MTTQPRETPKGRQCPRCEKTHEECADAQRCEGWRISYEVCVTFGTRPLGRRRRKTSTQ